MRYVKLGLLVVLILLSLATGATKLVSLPAEMELFRNAGWPDLLIYAFGAVQAVGGLLLIVDSTRKIGATIMLVTFALASVVVLQNGMIPFFLFSMLFVALAALPFVPAMQVRWRT